MKEKQTKKTAVLVTAGFLALALLLAAAYLFLRPDTTVGAKTIHVTVVTAERDDKTFDLRTDALYLRQALEEQDLIAGEEGAFGLYVKTVDGVTADESRQEWWCFTKGGQELFTGVNDTPIEDGDSFEITLTTW